jgi:CheY-like chemotaxis protein/two-component sensor histidine kinase
MIDDLLDITRIARNKLELRREPVELADVIRTAVETSRPLIDAGGHEFTIELPPSPPLVVNADQTRLAQCVSNLLNNAAKYTNAGGQISLIVERQGSDALIHVKDNGIGISPQMLPRIFGMFQQLDRSLGHSQGGLGIGLTLVKRLVQMHGGSVEAQSEGPGKGSEFTMRLPLQVNATSSPMRPQDVPAPQRQAPSESSLRVLIVDDNRDSANSLVLLLRITGHNARAAYDGLEAVQLAESFQPHVVVLDIGMPRLNGYQAAERMREQSWSKGATFIAVTGWGQEGDKQRATDAGFDHHIVKPVDPNALLALLESIQQEQKVQT